MVRTVTSESREKLSLNVVWTRTPLMVLAVLVMKILSRFAVCAVSFPTPLTLLRSKLLVERESKDRI